MQRGALFFGELLTTFRVLLGISFIISAWPAAIRHGPITMRMLASPAQKEIDISTIATAESLFDLRWRDFDLRARIQTLIIRMTMPIEGVFETTQEIVD